MKTQTSKHTPGPWRVDALGVVTGGVCNCTSVAETYRIKWLNSLARAEKNKSFRSLVVIEECEKSLNEAKANGYLIESAPQLLEACKSALQVLDEYEIENEIREELFLAITKAERLSE